MVECAWDAKVTPWVLGEDGMGAKSIKGLLHVIGHTEDAKSIIGDATDRPRKFQHTSRVWQAHTERRHDSPPLMGFRLFGAEFTPVKSLNIQISRNEEAPVRQFALAELQLNVDIHAISVPYRRRAPSA